MLGEMLAYSDLPPFIVPPSELEFGSFPPPYELVLTTVTIIPGNRYFRLEGKSYYFNRNMPLEELVSEAKNWQGLPMNDIILLGES